MKNAKNDQLFKLSHSKSDLHFNQLKSHSPKNPNLVEIGSMVVEKLKCAKVLSGRQTDAGQIVIKKSNDNNNFEQMYMVV